jgi:hypothetical protein
MDDDYPNSLTSDELLGLLKSEDGRDRIVAESELARRGLLPKTIWQKIRPWLVQAVWVGIVAYAYFQWR